MTVAELIAELQKFPPDAQVLILETEYQRVVKPIASVSQAEPPEWLCERYHVVLAGDD
jgi:hypothetical protein